mmetsp:Transcript_61090/g.175292  ORF Transcript_61090/g.175292 Transcript_61090/m.175292 type:complete len:289 (+) Transcript_61090:426-1292(+)
MLKRPRKWKYTARSSACSAQWYSQCLLEASHVLQTSTSARHTQQTRPPWCLSHGLLHSEQRPTTAGASSVPAAPASSGFICARLSKTKLAPRNRPPSGKASRYLWMPPCSWKTPVSSVPCMPSSSDDGLGAVSSSRRWRYAEAFSQRMPPVQYIITRLPRRSSRLLSTNLAHCAVCVMPGSEAPSKCPTSYSKVFLTSSRRRSAAGVSLSSLWKSFGGKWVPVSARTSRGRIGAPPARARPWRPKPTSSTTSLTVKSGKAACAPAPLLFQSTAGPPQPTPKKASTAAS